MMGGSVPRSGPSVRVRSGLENAYAIPTPAIPTPVIVHQNERVRGGAGSGRSTGRRATSTLLQLSGALGRALEERGQRERQHRPLVGRQIRTP